MPTSKTKVKNAAIAAKSASMTFKKALIERARGAELGHHLGYASDAAKPEATGN